MHRVVISDFEYVLWPTVTRAHQDAIASVIRSGKWHYGPMGDALERRLEVIFGRPAVATSSCAWAIFLALRALDLPRSKVVVPAFGYHGTSHPVIWAGFEPKFVDCDPHTYNICPEALLQALREEPIAAIVGVHMHGRPLARSVIDIALSSGVPLIEDACQAQGAKLDGEAVGAIGDVAALSFNSRKTNPAGLGGACIFRDGNAATRAQLDTNYGPKNSDGEPLAFGSYLPIGEFDAALAAHQLDNVDNWTDLANAKVELLRRVLAKRLPLLASGELSVWHKVRIRGSESERAALQVRGVRTSKWVTHPLPSYALYRKFAYGQQFPGADDICLNTFCLFDDETPIAAQPTHLVEKIAQIVGETLND